MQNVDGRGKVALNIVKRLLSGLSLGKKTRLRDFGSFLCYYIHVFLRAISTRLAFVLAKLVILNMDCPNKNLKCQAGDNSTLTDVVLFFLSQFLANVPCAAAMSHFTSVRSAIKKDYWATGLE